MKYTTMVDIPLNPTIPFHIYLIYIYKEDLALNNLQWLICHKAQQSQIIYLIGFVGKVFANGPGDWGLIPGRVIPKTLKVVLDTSLLNTRQYKVHIVGLSGVIQGKE